MAKALTRKQRILAEYLFDVWDDRDFVLGIILMLQGDEEVQEMLDYIESKDWGSPSDLTIKALFIVEDREIS